MVAGDDFVLGRGAEAAEDERALGSDAGGEGWGEGEEDVAVEVGDHEGEAVARQRLADGDAIADAVLRGGEADRAAGEGVDVGGDHVADAELEGDEGEHAGSGADVEGPSMAAWDDQRFERLDAEACGLVMAVAERARGIEAQDVAAIARRNRVLAGDDEEALAEPHRRARLGVCGSIGLGADEGVR